MSYSTFSAEDFWPPNRIEEFQSRASLKSYRDGAVLFWPGDASQAVYLIEEGHVKICHYTDSGDMVVLFVHGPGEIVGAGGVLDNRSRGVYAVADGVGCRLWEISADTFLNMLNEESEFAVFVATNFARRMRKMDQQVLRSSSLTAGQRLAQVLYELSGKAEITEGNHIKIVITHQELSNMIAACRQTTTALLKDLKNKGILLTKKGYIEILDARALETEAASEK